MIRILKNKRVATIFVILLVSIFIFNNSCPGGGPAGWYAPWCWNSFFLPIRALSGTWEVLAFLIWGLGTWRLRLSLFWENQLTQILAYVVFLPIVYLLSMFISKVIDLFIIDTLLKNRASKKSS